MGAENWRKKNHKVNVTWEYLRAMMRYVWIGYPTKNGSEEIVVTDRYTGQKNRYHISWN